ncbi:hypothetical protein Dd1591_2460 [Dickeya chrysanthemi Ech1591]|uniref:Uncharacterized protein n=1 Tax=Dickeya chrysanthemi (strain Ech1591) TaxID=561229 RepID=C6CL52_DICC1|nr:hypothetical protein Dd1591_2460 [Dickeya chrysanthemi Ech1591]
MLSFQADFETADVSWNFQNNNALPVRYYFLYI